MSMKKRWKNYCDGDTRSATEDDWNNFVIKVYAVWRGKKMQDDTNKPVGPATEILKYAEKHYGYKAFVASAEEYKELAELESKRAEL
jgi:hypothetical protein